VHALPALDDPRQNHATIQATHLIHDGYIYAEIQKGMYDLPQSSILANKLLVKQVATHNYAPTKRTHGLWKHTT
jgi:hypothetical protein